MRFPVKEIARLPKKAPHPPVMLAAQSFGALYSAYMDYKKTVAFEQTRREAIRAWRDVRVTELSNQKEILELYLKETFKERGKAIEGLFERLDRAIEMGNDHLMEKSIEGIMSIVQQSPLVEAAKLMDAMNNPDVKVIDI